MPTRFERIIEIARLDPASRYATQTMIELQALTMLSVFGNYFRLTVEESPGVFTYPSIITVIEAPSGAGKNSITRLLEKFVFNQAFQRMRDDWYCEEVSFKNTSERLAETEAMELFPGDDKKSEDKRIKHVDKRNKEFSRRKRPLDVFTSIHGSYEGFAFDRAYLEKFSYGAPYVRVEEYGNLILEMKQASYLKKMYDSLVDLIDNPRLTPKSIKDKEGATPGSDGMGLTCLFTLSNPTEKQKEYIESIILQAVGRRGFLVSETIETLDHDRATQSDVYDLDALRDISYEVLTCFEFIVERLNSTPNRCVPMTPEAKAAYEQIRVEVGRRYSEHAKSGIRSDKKMQIATVLKDLDRKILKIATLFAIFNHGEIALEITADDLSLAQAFGEKFFLASKAYFNDAAPSNTEKIIAYILEKKFTPARGLWEAGLFPGIPGRSLQENIAEVMRNEIIPAAEGLGIKIILFKKRKADWYGAQKMSPEEIEESRLNESFEVPAEMLKGWKISQKSS